ncbi:MAG: M28 family peptidase [Bacteroidales bacterium]|nr:M28 family peptidase [Bacteroidales bacterium]
MKKLFNYVLIITLLTLNSYTLSAQKKSRAADFITSSDLESYVSFLASPLLKGRMNGEPELEIAQQYIASQAKILGLKPANGNSYFQPYTIVDKKFDPEKTMIQVISKGNDTATIKKPVYQWMPTGPSDLILDGEVIFAGYGIKADKYAYNDLEGLTTEGKILLVMSRAPTSEDGQKFLFEGTQWASFMSYTSKLSTLLFTRAKAILFVMDPKSGYLSIEEQFRGLSGELSSSKNLKGEKIQTFDLPGMPRIMFIHRTVADELLKGTGLSLSDLQKQIDKELKPHSFPIADKHLKITEVTFSEEKTLHNVAAYIEGSDPLLKSEVIVLSGHFDHIGGSGDRINPGADDDASGCAALLSMAEAFQNLEKKPLRSILFLWVSGEEIGLFGSKSYTDNPLFPLEKTVVDLNMDMIGRVKGIGDTTAATPMTGPEKVFVIADYQSKELMAIAEEADKSSVLDFDYSLSGRNHPLQLFNRSDHYNFASKDIPVLFFTCGLHTDYHKPGDVIEKIDFKKMELITRTVFRIGLSVANKKTKLIVDNPFSKW